MNIKTSYLHPNEISFFERSFDESMNRNTEEITFRNFREIVNNHKKFSKNLLSVQLEKMIKRAVSQNEDEVYLSKTR
jgi:hypothetical protein